MRLDARLAVDLVENEPPRGYEDVSRHNLLIL
jgi:hypothetical protein